MRILLITSLIIVGCGAPQRIDRKYLEQSDVYGEEADVLHHYVLYRFSVDGRYDREVAMRVQTVEGEPTVLDLRSYDAANGVGQIEQVGLVVEEWTRRIDGTTIMGFVGETRRGDEYRGKSTDVDGEVSCCGEMTYTAVDDVETVWRGMFVRGSSAQEWATYASAPSEEDGTDAEDGDDEGVAEDDATPDTGAPLLSLGSKVPGELFKVQDAAHVARFEAKRENGEVIVDAIAVWRTAQSSNIYDATGLPKRRAFLTNAAREENISVLCAYDADDIELWCARIAADNYDASAFTAGRVTVNHETTSFHFPRHPDPHPSGDPVQDRRGIHLVTIDAAGHITGHFDTKNPDRTSTRGYTGNAVTPAIFIKPYAFPCTVGTAVFARVRGSTHVLQTTCEDWSD